jgi:hypothetical protein
MRWELCPVVLGSSPDLDISSGNCVQTCTRVVLGSSPDLDISNAE